MKILIAAGGTGGHLFPAIRLAEEIMLQQLGDVLFITSNRRQDRTILKNIGIRFVSLPLVGIQSKDPLHIINFLIRLIFGTVKSMFLLLRFLPARVIGFGGYVSGPILFLATLFRIKTIIHEQNVYPGKTNRWLSRFVDRIAISFPESLEYLKGFTSKIILSGNPLRKGLERIEKRKDNFVILVMGGSQGSSMLNKLIPEAIGLIGEDRKKAIQMIHISGYQQKDEVARSYQGLGIKSSVLPFIDTIHELYNESDFVIARSGATTVAELLYLKKPCILIPYPHGGGHQRFNAEVLTRRGLSVLLEENSLTQRILKDAVVALMDRDVLKNMSERVKDAQTPDACGVLIEEIKK